MGTILAPSYKLEFFRGEDWVGDDADWYNVYEASLHKYLEQYFQQIPTTSVVDKSKAPIRNGTMRALMAQNNPQTPPQEKVGWQDELRGYLNLRMYYLLLKQKNSLLIILGIDETDPCQFWKAHDVTSAQLR